eukprot:15066263-Alexandrium_andersonii.AAC.1
MHTHTHGHTRRMPEVHFAAQNRDAQAKKDKGKKKKLSKKEKQLLKKIEKEKKMKRTAQRHAS